MNKYDNCICGGLKKIQSKVCKKCIGSDIIENRTYKFYKDRHKNWWSARIPICKDARNKFNKSNIKKECYNCGYSKHIEVCHIKAVNEFTDDAKLKEINDINNLIALCRNHHWELDNNLITI